METTIQIVEHFLNIHKRMFMEAHNWIYIVHNIFTVHAATAAM